MLWQVSVAHASVANKAFLNCTSAYMSQLCPHWAHLWFRWIQKFVPRIRLNEHQRTFLSTRFQFFLLHKLRGRDCILVRTHSKITAVPCTVSRNLGALLQKHRQPSSPRSLPRSRMSMPPKLSSAPSSSSPSLTLSSLPRLASAARSSPPCLFAPNSLPVTEV